MDDLYDDLENYDDVNAIQELINENKELKFKVEEYTLAIAKLQKNILQDFDKVSMDYKRLEANYSSLLRTAKAEIERKTQTIASLNMEKDMLVLSSIQNTNKSIQVLRRNMARGRSNNLKNQRKDETESAKTNKNDVQDVKKQELERVRNNENRLPSTDTVSSGNTGDSNKIIKIENKSGKLDVYDETSETKENVAKGKKALSVKHRRKSMPVLNKQVKFSSDEEFEDDCSDDVKRERFLREEKSRKYFDRHKISETSGIDEKYSSYHESSRETYYKGKSHRPMDKYRSIKDKSRFRKHFSPEKVRRPTRDYHEDERQELFRHNRVLVSPPRERINPVRMFRDRRSNHERDRSLEERHSRRDDFDDRMRKNDFHEERPKPRDDYRQGRHPQKYSLKEERQRSRSRSNEFASRRRGTSHEERFAQKSDALDKKSISRDSSTEARHKQIDETNKEGLKNVHEDKQKKNSRSIEARRKQNDETNKEGERDLHEDKQKKICSSLEPKQKHIDETNKEERDLRENKQKKISSSLEARHKQNDETNTEGEKGLREDKQKKISSIQTVNEERKSRRRERIVETPSDNDEPSSKRAKNDSCKTVDELVECSEEPHIAREKLLPEFATHLQFTSCQSPDDPHHDVHPQPAIPSSTQPKEIMTTSSSYIEDPRLVSKKYVKGVSGDKIVLETVTGRNVDLIAIDISRWGIPRVKVPCSLQQPPEFSDEIVQEIYMDIDNPILNTSLELEDIQSESNDGRMVDYLSKNFYQDYENERIKQIEAKADKELANVKHKRDAMIKQDLHKKEFVDFEQDKNLSSEPKLPPVKYKLPRPSNPALEQDSAPNPLGILIKHLKPVCGEDPVTKPPEAKLDVDATFGTDDDSQDSEHKKDKPKEVRQLRGRTISAQELVEGDLALSDETSDNLFMQRQKRKHTSDNIFMQRQKRKQKLKEKCNIVSKTEKKIVVDIEQKTAKPVAKLNEKKSRKLKTEIKVSDQNVEEYKTNEAGSTTDDKSIKKTRKKPTSKQKSASTKESANTVNTEKVTEKKTKGKKSKSPKDINHDNKFSELFGDSSSLMTPEDLGMVTKTQVEKTKNYVPIMCEDAQDAVDVNVNAMKKKQIDVVQLPVTTSKIDENTTIIEEPAKSLICKINLSTQSASKTNIKENDADSESAEKITPNMEVSKEEVTKEPDVVKTVIISKGVQPRIEDIEAKMNAPNKSKITETEVHEPVIPVALATSTPHKRLLLQLDAQIECNSSSSSNEVLKDTTPVDQSSASNGLSSDAQNDDKPDVRIFMKRRRRLKK